LARDPFISPKLIELRS